MTRDEAEKIVLDNFPGFYRVHGYTNKYLREAARRHVDTYVALGVLKLDEPVNPVPTAQDVFLEALGNSVWSRFGVEMHLKQLGMKVVKDE